jgi:FHS family L-fucose permease-like MFS transporter
MWERLKNLHLRSTYLKSRAYPRLRFHDAVGTILGPYVAGIFVFSKPRAGTGANDTIYLPYLIVGGMVTVLIVLFSVCPLPELRAEEETHPGPTRAGDNGKPLLHRRHFVLAVVAQFLYVAAQTGIFSYFVNYATGPDMPSLAASVAQRIPASWTENASPGLFRLTDLGASGLLASCGFVLFLAGRAIGSTVLNFFRADRTLALFALANVAMMTLVLFPFGWISFAALLLSFFFMSIMYPTIFALGIRGLGEDTKLGSSLIVMAIVGGAIMPLFMGWLADRFSMRVGFSMPLICFVFILAYALWWPKLDEQDARVG